MSILNKNRLFPKDPSTAKIASMLFELVENIPIISPHGHTDARWFSENNPFENPTDLFVTPDHYVYRMLLSQGIELSSIGLSPTGDVESKRSKKDRFNNCSSKEMARFIGKQRNKGWKT